MADTAYFHLPGLFEFYDLYKVFLPLFYEKREYFYSWCDIGSIYGSPADCLWGGGRTGFGDSSYKDVADLIKQYPVSARLTFSNSLLEQKHLSDKKCNALCSVFEKGFPVQNGVIIYSDLLMDYIKTNYPEFYFVSSTTKVITDFDDFISEVKRPEFKYVVPDFRLNAMKTKLKCMTQEQKDKTEFLCNECCNPGCLDRKNCYKNVSLKNLGEDCPDFVCPSSTDGEGYKFSKAIKSPLFISTDDIKNVFMPMGFSNFKIEGRGLGSALILEFLLYYMTKSEYHINVRERIYLDSCLDLF